MVSEILSTELLLQKRSSAHSEEDEVLWQAEAVLILKVAKIKGNVLSKSKPRLY